MRRLQYILMIFSLVCFNKSANAQAFQWAKNMGSDAPGGDIGYSIALDATNNIILTGKFVDTVDFDPGISVLNLYAVGGTDIFIQKLSGAGNLLWAKSIGGIGSESAYSVKVDQDENIYLTGIFSNMVDFDPGPAVFFLTSVSSTDIFVMKLDSAGNFIWAKAMGGFGPQIGWSLATGSDKSVCVVGQFQNSVDFDPGPGIFNIASNGQSDVFVVKLDSMGNFAWAKSIGGSLNDNAKGIALDQNNNVIISGSYGGTVDFDPGPPIYNLIASYADMFILKLDANGNFLWVRDTQGAGTDVANAITIDGGGNIFLTGYFGDTVDFDAGIGVYNLIALNNYENDAFVVKFDANGSIIWGRSMGGGGPTPLSISVGTNGNIYTIGSFNDTLDLNPALGYYYVIANTTDAYISALDGNGIFIWGQKIGGIENDIGNGIIADNQGAVYATGFFAGIADFDPGASQYYLTAVGGSDIFVLKYNYCGANYNVSYNACDSILLFGNTYYTSGTYVQQFMNAQDCDSNLIMNITIKPNSYGSLTDSACGKYYYYGQVYDSSGTYSQAIPNAQGCDSIITLTLNIHSINTGITQNGLTFTANATGAVNYQWIKCNPYQLLVGEVNQVFNATANGEYALIVTDTECDDTSACFTVHSVGLQEDISISKINLFPNPVLQNLHIESENELQDATIKISSMDGKTNFEYKNISTFKMNIDVTGLSTGIYYVEIFNAGFKIVRKIYKD